VTADALELALLRQRLGMCDRLIVHGCLPTIGEPRAWGLFARFWCWYGA